MSGERPKIKKDRKRGGFYEKKKKVETREARGNFWRRTAGYSPSKRSQTKIPFISRKQKSRARNKRSRNSRKRNRRG